MKRRGRYKPFDFTTALVVGRQRLIRELLQHLESLTTPMTLVFVKGHILLNFRASARQTIDLIVPGTPRLQKTAEAANFSRRVIVLAVDDTESLHHRNGGPGADSDYGSQQPGIRAIPVIRT